MENDNTESEKNSQGDFIELEKGIKHIILEIVEYVPHAVMSRTILKKATGSVTAMSFSEGEELSEKIVPFDNYIQVIDGVADLTIGEKNYQMKVGTGITIPAHSLQYIYANQQFKIISIIIKSGYENY